MTLKRTGQTLDLFEGSSFWTRSWVAFAVTVCGHRSRSVERNDLQSVCFLMESGIVVTYMLITRLSFREDEGLEDASLLVNSTRLACIGSEAQLYCHSRQSKLEIDFRCRYDQV
jgi:hypothetical protein